MSFSPNPAGAQPAAPQPPTSAADALKQIQDLQKQEDQLGEQYLQAQADQQAKQAEVDKANADLAKSKQMADQANAQEEQFRGSVDALANASFQGARFNKISALLSGTNAQDFLDRASALTMLATDNQNALQKFVDAVDEATAAQNLATDALKRASDAKAAADKLAADVAAHKADLDKQVLALRDAMAKLSPAQLKQIQPPDDNGQYVGGPGLGGGAVDAALTRRGMPYVWGAAGPSSFDCSGLTMWAYAQVGVSLPHSSRSQASMGKAVSQSQLQPGDLLFYGSPVHHVAMYVGNGMIIHASTTGQPVKVVPISGGGSDYVFSRRIVG